MFGTYVIPLVIIVALWFVIFQLNWSKDYRFFGIVLGPLGVIFFIYKLLEQEAWNKDSYFYLFMVLISIVAFGKGIKNLHIIRKQPSE